MTQEPQGNSNALERLAPLALGLLFLLALAGGIALLVERNAPDGIEVILPTPTVAPTQTTPPTLQVYLTGAVARPGVYTYNDGDRLDDLLRDAGGVTDAADLERLNLAQRLRDEAHIHVLAVGEIAPPSTQEGDVPSSDTPTLLNLNTATQEQLEGLPGIGAVRASDIIEYRDAIGGFTSLKDLLEVPGIGSATIIGIVDLVIVE